MLYCLCSSSSSVAAVSFSSVLTLPPKANLFVFDSNYRTYNDECLSRPNNVCVCVCV